MGQAVEEHDHFWLVEVTEPDLYIGNKAKLIDVLVKPNAEIEPGRGIEEDIIFFRLPGTLVLPSGHCSNLCVEGHLPLYASDPTRPKNTIW